LKNSAGLVFQGLSHFEREISLGTKTEIRRHVARSGKQPPPSVIDARRKQAKSRPTRIKMHLYRPETQARQAVLSNSHQM
jgi:hypothetical protein